MKALQFIWKIVTFMARNWWVFGPVFAWIGKQLKKLYGKVKRLHKKVGATEGERGVDDPVGSATGTTNGGDTQKDIS